MSRSRRDLLLGAGAGLILAGAPFAGASRAMAHQRKAGLTRLLFNPRTGNIEAMHRFYSHDAEHAVRVLFDPEADILQQPAVREQFGLYAAERFHIAGVVGGTDTPIALDYVGCELDGAFIWVYQEAPGPDVVLDGVAVENAVLMDLWPEQYNLVNIERAGVVRSLTFAGKAGVQTAMFG